MFNKAHWMDKTHNIVNSLQNSKVQKCATFNKWHSKDKGNLGEYGGQFYVST